MVDVMEMKIVSLGWTSGPGTIFGGGRCASSRSWAGPKREIERKAKRVVIHTRPPTSFQVGRQRYATNSMPSALGGKTKVAFFFSFGGLCSQLTEFNELSRITAVIASVNHLVWSALWRFEYCSSKVGAAISDKTFGAGEGSQVTSAAFSSKIE